MKLPTLFRLPSPALLKFYTAFAIFCLGDRSWTFVNAFFFEALGGMRLVGVDQFVESCASMLASTAVGAWLDGRNRRAGARLAVAAHTVAMAASAALLAMCIWLIDGGGHAANTAIFGDGSPVLLNVIFVVSAVLSILLSSTTKCASDGERLVFTKDWVMVMASSEPQQKQEQSGDAGPYSSLSKINSTMVMIDQLATVLGPLVVGFLLSFFGPQLVCTVLVAWNVFALISIQLLLNRVYKTVRGLAHREEADNKRTNPPEGTVKTAAATSNAKVACHRQIIAQIRTYYRQSVFPAAFGLALLYLTVLGFDGFAVGFGRSQGLPDNVIGMYRSVSSVLGLLGALTFEPAERTIGLRRTGLIGLTLQHLCLWLCVLSIWLPGSPFDPIGYAMQWGAKSSNTTSALVVHNNQNRSLILIGDDALLMNGDSDVGKTRSLASITLFFIGLTTSRFGLWIADLAIIQLMQLHIGEWERGTVFGVQNGCSMLFSMCKDVLVVVLPDPSTFGLLILVSILCVGVGFLQYIHYLVQTKSEQKRVKPIELCNTTNKPH